MDWWIWAIVIVLLKLILILICYCNRGKVRHKRNMRRLEEDIGNSSFMSMHCEKNNWKTVETGEQLVNLALCSYLYPECS